MSDGTPRPDLFNNGAPLIPGNPGNSGGKKGRSGPLPNAIRAEYRKHLWRNHKFLARVAAGKKIGKGDAAIVPTLQDRKWAIELMCRYGIGGIVAQVDSEGGDLPTAGPAGKLTPAQIREEVARILAEPSSN